MSITWPRIRKAFFEHWHRLKEHIQKEAGQELAGPELVVFAIGLAGQKLLDDIAQIHTLTGNALNLLCKIVLVVGLVGFAIVLVLNGFLGIL